LFDFVPLNCWSVEMEFSRALRLIRSSNARLTCLAVELRHKASFPPKV
jgi:hypothetical protein